MITVHSYKTCAGETRVCIAHSAGSMPAENGMPGVRTTLLNEAEARKLLVELTMALDPKACLDCSSDLHHTGSSACPVANQDDDGQD